MADTALRKKYTISQAAKLAGISKRTLQRWIKAKKIRASLDQFGTHIISSDDLQTVIPSSAIKPAERSEATVSPALHRYLPAMPRHAWRAGAQVVADGGVFTASEAARALGISKRTILRWEAAGLVKSTRTVGGARRYTQEDVRSVAASRAAYQHVPKEKSARGGSASGRK